METENRGQLDGGLTPRKAREIIATRLARYKSAAVWKLNELPHPVMSYEENGEPGMLHMDCTPDSQAELRRLFVENIDVDYCYRVARVFGHV